MGIKLKIVGEEEVKLTDFSIYEYKKRVDEIKGDNEYISKHLKGIEIFGKLNVHDTNEEKGEVNKLSQWSKKSAIEEVAYGEVIVEFYDVNNKNHNMFNMKKAFVLEYEETFDLKEGKQFFYVYIREFDRTEEAVSE
jgi:hypothetical protein